MDPDDNVCLCFRVSQRKLITYMNREKPAVASQLADCLSAGTGCQWCVPFLRKLHEQWQQGEEPNLEVSPTEYAERRKRYRATGRRDDAIDPQIENANEIENENKHKHEHQQDQEADLPRSSSDEPGSGQDAPATPPDDGSQAAM